MPQGQKESGFQERDRVRSRTAMDPMGGMGAGAMGGSMKELTAMLPLGDNQFFAGGLGLALLGAGASVLRRSGSMVSMMARRHLVMTLEVTSKDASYPWVLQWLNSHGRRTQHLSVNTVAKEHNKLGFDLVPGPGKHLINYQGRYFLVERAREHQTVNMTSGTPWEKVTLSSFGRDPSCFEALLREAQVAAMPEEEGTTTVFTCWGTEWRPFGQVRPECARGGGGGGGARCCGDEKGVCGCERGFGL